MSSKITNEHYQLKLKLQGKQFVMKEEKFSTIYDTGK